MSDDSLISIVHRLVLDYVRSPSLRHIRDPHFSYRLARQIVEAMGRRQTIWGKWSDAREALGRVAAYCWIPVGDLRDELNEMEGPRLTTTDVAQRLRAFNEEDHEPLPQEEFREGCLELYRRERAEGTSMAAIVGAIQEFVEQQTEAQRQGQLRRYRETVEANRIALQQRLLSGADCKWTPIDRSPGLYCRHNGRTYRLDPVVDGTFFLHRIADLTDKKGHMVGRYRRRGDATKALKEIAYADEPRR